MRFWMLCSGGTSASDPALWSADRRAAQAAAEGSGRWLWWP